MHARAAIISAWGKFLTGAALLVTSGGAAWSAASGNLHPLLQWMGLVP
jgi:hypothetical protein